MNGAALLTSELDEMVTAYAAAMLWAGLDWPDDGGEPVPLDDNYGPDDVHPDAMASIRGDCRAFALAELDDLRSTGGEWGQHGHDFLLTRDGHGAGFWDRGYGPAGDRLTAAAHVYGDSGAYVGDDGKVYVG